MSDNNLTADELFDKATLCMIEMPPDTNVLAEMARLHRLAAGKGHVNAQSCLARYCEVAEQDIEQAIYWYAKAAEQGHEGAAENLERLRAVCKRTNDPEAQYEIAVKYQAEDRFAEAFKWYRLAAERGHAAAQYNVGLMISATEGITVRAEAFHWFKKIAFEGYRQGIEALVMLICPAALEEMESEPMDPVAETDDVLHRTAKEGDGTAQYQLSMDYYAKNEVAEAIKWARHAAIQGVKEAQMNLGFHYEIFGDNAKEAIFWHAKAAMQWNGSAIDSLIRLGLEELETLTDPPTDEDMEYAKERVYALGMWALENPDQATINSRQYFMNASNQFFLLGLRGNAEALFSLAFCFFMGYGVEKDQAEAVYWWKRAADKGSIEAMRNLVSCYAQGFGVEQDEVFAEEWTQKVEQASLGVRKMTGKDVQEQQP